MNNREYIDQIIKSIETQVMKHKENNIYVTREFFDSPEIKLNSKIAIDAIANALSWPSLDQNTFTSFFEVAIKEFRDKNATDILPSISIRKNQKESWLTIKRQDKLNWNTHDLSNYRNRYLHYLSKIGRPKKYVDETRRSSLEILKKMGDPKSQKEFYVKGLVVGSVQSGKTANFNAVINSSIDSGYKLIIVLSGIMEDLRKQTQQRIEKEVVGYSKAGSGFLGVGEIQPFGELGDSKVAQIVIPTSSESDFKKTIKEADFSLNNKNILVCKKNTGVLKNLLLWLSDYLDENKEKHDLPFLIIDDEADNASLNNMGHRGKEYATTINGHIRALLGLFNRKTYLGYTATPFANVLQDKNEVPETKWTISYREKGETKTKDFVQVSNLFPEDFIELLYPPSVYIGAKHFFETRIDDIKKIEPLIPPPLRDHIDCFPSRVTVPEIEPTTNFGRGTRASRKDDPFPKYLPESLKEAIMCFILSIAIRLSRKEEMHESYLRQPHNTMLIHISRFTNWQNTTKKLIVDYVSRLTESLNNDLPSSTKSIYSVFERTWYKYYAYVVENISTYLPDDYEDNFLTKKTFDDAKQLLVEAVSGIEVVAVNSASGDELIYPDKTEKKYIAIGGNKLSRGFTLEGLTINYFTRNTNFADSLLQMGRWFGYRPGYIDCCKLFTTRNNIDKFDLTTTTIEELEHAFKDMNRLNKTPREFILWVKTNPRVIRVTRTSMTRNTVQKRINYSGGIEQSTKFEINKHRIENAWKDFESLCSKKDWKFDNPNFFTFQTDNKGLYEFLDLENSFANFETPGVKEYIKLCNEVGKLTNWTIAIKRNMGAKVKIELQKQIQSFPENMYLTIRRGPKPLSQQVSRDSLLQDDIFRASGKSANLVSTGDDFSITLTSDEKRKAEERFYENKISEYIDSGFTKKEAIEKANRIKSIPDKIYRRSMQESDGILMIYLIDAERIFESTQGEEDKELLEYRDKKKIDINTPLIGYALGFPNISDDIGGVYITSDHQYQLEFEEDEFDESIIDTDL
ncbi:Z1 domain-containing protein [Winogradskyella sp. PE311]|uniref:Z1 domain-containing protein n=1 Tax=Winogradskyella sp. PE311 TaxID=3366943 RepID=UPI00397E91EB